MLKIQSKQNDLYREASAEYGPALERLVRAYEADPDKRRDLLQEIHLALWRSFDSYQGRCSIRTWVYRIAHNTAASYVIRQRRSNLPGLISLEQLEAIPEHTDLGRSAEERIALDRLMELIHRLKPFDRQLMLLYLEGIDAESIGETAGISAGNVRIQIHRIKAILSRRFHGGESHES
jgi:RNA polymerase sigma-70 factor (ECF subfamily)